MRTMIALVTAALLVPAVVHAQDPAPAPPAPAASTSNVVRPGMLQPDVVAAWGEPDAIKQNGDWTFLFYRNYDEQRVGWMDVVFLQRGQVVDAITRGSNHAYAGQSSSPPDRAPEATIPATPTQP